MTPDEENSSRSHVPGEFPAQLGATSNGERMGSRSALVGLALLATLLAIWFKISTALTEIVVGTVAQFIIGAFG